FAPSASVSCLHACLYPETGSHFRETCSCLHACLYPESGSHFRETCLEQERSPHCPCKQKHDQHADHRAKHNHPRALQKSAASGLCLFTRFRPAPIKPLHLLVLEIAFQHAVTLDDASGDVACDLVGHARNVRTLNQHDA